MLAEAERVKGGFHGRSRGSGACVSGGILACCLAVLALSADPTPLYSQVPGRGAISIEIVDEGGRALQGVQARLVDTDDPENVRSVTTSSTGLANFFFIPAGTFHLEIERLGNVPIRIQDVVITPGERDRLRLELRASPPPVTEVDEYRFSQLTSRSGAAGSLLLDTRSHLLPMPSGEPASLLGPAVGSSSWAGGLPARFQRLEFDGVAVAIARSPEAGVFEDRFDAFPRPFLSAATLRRSGALVGGEEGPGSLLELRGRENRMSSQGRVAAGAQWIDGGDHAEAVLGPWVDASGSAALQGDTLRVGGGFAFERVARSAPVLLAPESNATMLLEPAGELDPSVTSLRPIRQRDRFSAYGRMDWAPTRSTSLLFHLSTGVVPEHDPAPTPLLPEGTLASSSGTDLFGISRFLYTTEGGDALEVNLGFGRSDRTSGAGAGGIEGGERGVSFLEEGGTVGGFRDAHGEFSLTSLTFSPVLTITGPRYRARAGAQGSQRAWTDRRSGDDREWTLRPGASASGSEGLLSRTLRSVPRDLSIRQRQLGFFGEVRFWMTPDLWVAGEARVDRESLPRAEIGTNDRWQEATGIDRIQTGAEVTRLSPAFELRWEPAEMPGWSLAARAEVQPGWSDPTLIGLVVAERGGNSGITDFSGVGRHVGEQLYLLGPNFQPPRGQRFSARVETTPSEQLRLGAELFHHSSDFLPRFRDLNRARGTGVMDQFGRSHVGEMAARNGLVAIVPGSDRRFPDFHEVWALESDGWSETSGASIAATLELDGLVVEGQYTLSRSRDNAPFGVTGWPIPVSGAVGVDARDAAWVEGRSDRDRPHQLQIAGLLELPQAGESTVSLRYTLESGLPFTPGVRDGLGGEWEGGWSRVQPIALPSGETLPASGDGWSCSTTTDPDSGRLERNTCRGNALQGLDARLDLAVPGFGARNVVLRLEAFNLLDQVEALRDPALFQVTTQGGLPGAVDGRVDLPFVRNETFGEPIARLPGGRSFRLGLEYRF